MIATALSALMSKQVSPAVSAHTSHAASHRLAKENLEATPFGLVIGSTVSSQQKHYAATTDSACIQGAMQSQVTHDMAKLPAKAARPGLCAIVASTLALHLEPNAL